MELRLKFADGLMTGDGIDDVAPFLISGKYDTANLECHWTKTYPGSHDVASLGFREGKGIWGTWQIGRLARGGFHSWPIGGEEMATESRTEASSDWLGIPREGIWVGKPGVTVPLRRA